MTTSGRSRATVPRGPTTYVGLLTHLANNTLDEDYQTVSDRRPTGSPENARPAPRRNRHVWIVAVLAVFGLLLGVSALLTEQNRPLLSAERQGLIEQAHQRQARLDAVHAQLAQLQHEVSQLQQSVSVQNATMQNLSAALTQLGMVTGALAVHGPGVVFTLDDAPEAIGSNGGGVILDTDLQSLVNGLWSAGAEAISINDHRLTAVTAIRYAGRAITVDYRSLTPPYVVTVIGNPDTLPAEFLQTQGGQLWLGLHANFGIKFQTATSEDVSVPADPHNLLLYAKPAGG